MLGRGGRGGSQNQDGLALALSAPLAVGRRSQHPFLPPDGERATSPQQHPPPSDWRSGDQRPGSSRPSLCGVLSRFLLPGAG